MKHPSLKESAYRIIKDKLLNGEFEAGSRIREDLLAEEINMSRTPVREAINQLSAEGFVDNVPRKGIFINALTTGEISEFLDIRESLEVLAIDKCIDYIDDVQLKALEAIVSEFDSGLSKGNYKECNELDSRFHLEIAKISRNKRLIRFLKEIEDYMRIARNLEKKEFPKEKNEITLKEHKAILEYIKNKDKSGGKEALRINIRRLKENLGI